MLFLASAILSFKVPLLYTHSAYSVKPNRSQFSTDLNTLELACAILGLPMINSEYITYWLVYRGLYHWICYNNTMRWRSFKLQWRARNRWPMHCSACGVKVKPSHGTDKYHPQRLSLDHIIPKSLIYELELYELLYDYDNFCLMCETCNVIKSDAKLDPDELSPVLLKKFHDALDRRRSEL